MEIKEDAAAPDASVAAATPESGEQVRPMKETGVDSVSKCESRGGEQDEEAMQADAPAAAPVVANDEKPDLNKAGGEHDDEDVVVLPSPRRKSQPGAPRDKDELLLTLGGSWGSREKISGKALAGAAAAAGDISLSLGSSPPRSASVFSGKMQAAQSVSVRSLSNTTTLSRSFLHNPSCSLTHNSLDDLNSSATQYVACHENETVSHGGLFAHLAATAAAAAAPDPQTLQRYRSPSSAMENNASIPPNTTLPVKNPGNNKEFPGKWNSYNLEKYHALFPDLKEGFRAKFSGTRRSKHRPEEHGRVYPGESRVGLYEIASEPVAGVAHRLQELPEIFLEDLKRSLTEMLGSVDKRDEFLRLQRILHRRNDLTAEYLYVAHRTQLELLVAMKTGIQAFLLRENPLQTSALVEIFLQKRCRNISCQSSLPVDDCDCQFCSQKEGFCSTCMCIACSKFDFMSNTCRWVGCDECRHWCHSECGIRLSYIKPGVSQGVGGKPGEPGMQFVCVACNQPSDLFGFAREVFKNFAKEWSSETLRQELDCIHRIFRRSQDLRGKQLCWIAERMLSKLEGCSDTSEICDALLRFFQEGKLEVEKMSGNSVKAAAQGGSGGRSSEMVYNNVTSPRGGGVLKKPEMTGSGNLQMLDRELEAKRDELAAMQYSRARKRSEIEEMESLIHIKQAEAKMFELRAEEARLEAERLRKIVVAKSEKIEEEFVGKGYKLHVNESVEKRKKCLMEYQMLEQGLQDFNSMKAKLASDVHDVLRKMDAVKRNRIL